MAQFMISVVVIVMPFLIEKFTQALVFTPIFTFCTVFGFMVMHSVTMQIENPYGDDYIDLPLAEMHMAFNAGLLAQSSVKPSEDPLLDYMKPMENEDYQNALMHTAPMQTVSVANMHKPQELAWDSEDVESVEPAPKPKELVQEYSIGALASQARSPKRAEPSPERSG